MIKTGCFTPSDLEELFDRNVFLYYEEKILGQKLKNLGLKALLAVDARYVHAHSVTIDKCYKKAADVKGCSMRASCIIINIIFIKARLP